MNDRGPLVRPAPYLVFGNDMPFTIVSGRVAALLGKAVLDDLRRGQRSIDAEAYQTLIALHDAANQWRSSATGTDRAPVPEQRADWLSTTQAGDLLGVTSRAIRQAIDRGRLSATLTDGRHRISREDLAHYKASLNR